jgi:hypothetical protein
MHKLLSSLLVAAALVAGCDNTPAAPVDVRGCWGAGCAIVTTSHYNPDFSGVGTINAVQMSQSKVVENIDSSLDPDVQVQIEGTKLYVLNRTTGSLRTYDLAHIAIEEEIATGSSAAPNTTSAPFSFWRSTTSSKIYLTLAGNDGAHALGIIDEAQPNAGVISYVDVPAAASDSDGNPELSSMYECNGTLYALSQSYTFMGAGISYAEGRIAAIDLKSDTFLGFITLAGKNPSAIVAEGDDCNQVLVATSSDLTGAPDGTGGIERVNLGARTTQGFIARDTDLQGRPFSLTKVSSKLWYIGMYFDPQMDAMGKIVLGSAKVAAWNPASPTTTMGDATGKAGFINFVELGTDGQLYVAVGTFDGTSTSQKLPQGLYIGKADGSLLPTMPLDLGDTPSAIAFQK